VQAVATGRLFRRGILVKSADALERLTGVDVIVFDKTGTLTIGQPELEAANSNDPDLALAASIAATSRHPLSRALVRVAHGAAAVDHVREWPGDGLEAEIGGNTVRLGRRQWCGAGDEDDGTGGPELWLARPGHAPKRFGFVESLRADAHAVVTDLKLLGYDIVLLSGDRAHAVRRAAQAAGIETWCAGLRPRDKVSYLEDLRNQGKNVLMVGDGLNDAPALAAATVSMSPSAAADVTQTAADLVFQGDRLGAVGDALRVALRADRLVKQNLGLAFAYNAIAIPAAMAGYVTPLIAAAAMSLSSLVVTLNALRLRIQSP
jgi:Cu2+-exporting ATPase